VENLDNAADAIARFHAKYPLRPSPADIPCPSRVRIATNQTRQV
jgi:hypothetical protein